MQLKIEENQDNIHELINACLLAKKKGFNSFSIDASDFSGIVFDFKKVSTEKERLIQQVTKAREEYEQLKKELKDLGWWVTKDSINK